MSDSNFQDFSTVQSGAQLPPQTLASAATITPTGFLTFITGTVQIANIAPPTTGLAMIMLIFTNAAPGILLTSGNIDNAVEPTQNIPVILVYNPVTASWFGGELKLT